MKKKKGINLKSFIIATLRRASYRWPARNEALRAARIERGLYQCAFCKQVFKKADIKLDHIAPVIDIEKGFTTWDDFINRLFCEKEGYQVLCTLDHDAKTSIEKNLRVQYRKDKKVVAKKKNKG